jgi:alpha-amylase
LERHSSLPGLSLKTAKNSFKMGVLLQGFFKHLPNNAVPSPADGDPSVDWWWDHLARQANAFKRSGFTAIWLPPVLKAYLGAGKGADGYEPFDDYDIGSRDQKGSLPTRYGTREQLQRCVAILRANGLDVYVDMVEHQRIGDLDPFIFRYPGADGTPDIGRFPKNPTNFLPQVPRDPNLGGPPWEDIAFGRELAPINALPRHYVSDNLTDAADWMTRALDIQGYRIDDVKGLSTDFLLPFLNSKSMAGKFAVGELYDGNQALVNAWIQNPRGMQGRASAFDFPLKFILNAMCDNSGRFNMADLDHAGLAGICPQKAVTFVENHDTDLFPKDRIVFNKILAYAYILTSEGYPCVYYRDYSTDSGCYGLKTEIDNLIWIHEKIAQGSTQERWKDFDVFAFERLGGAGLLVGLNNDPQSSHRITVATGFGLHAQLHDYTGHAENAVTDENGSVTINIPPNNNGNGFVCYSRESLDGGFTVESQTVRQDFEGAADLDILPALNGKTVTVGRIWSGENRPIVAKLIADTTAWTEATLVRLDILSPQNLVYETFDFRLSSSPDAALQTTSGLAGFYTLKLTTSNTPPTNLNPTFKLSVSYQSDPHFETKTA